MNTACRGMNAHQQIVERNAAAGRNDDLAIDDEAIRLQIEQRFDKLREISRHRLTRLRLKLYVFAVTKCQASEAIPLRLVLPFIAARDLVDDLRFHRKENGLDRQTHMF